VNIGIIGLPQTGKKTLFELLVGRGTLGAHHDPRRVVRGVADVQDARFDVLVDLYKPARQTRARVDALLLPQIEERAVSEGDIFRDFAEVEVFCHVVRAFEDDAVYHVSGSVDPGRDIDFVNGEFILHDLLFIEKRLERIAKDFMKAKSDHLARERELLERLRAPLEEEKPLRVVEIPAEDEKAIASYPLLSRRAMVVVLNVSDDDVADNRVPEFEERYGGRGIKFVQIAVRLAAEIASLEADEEREAFMRELGVEDTALHALTEKCIEALGLISFFTVASNEVRQWFVRRGALAVEAAGKIHTDLARGFIRAEVIRMADMLAEGSEEKVKAAGKLGVRGRDYVVEDGDLLFIRFNV
jgi:GTP-binding protein YchF